MITTGNKSAIKIYPSVKVEIRDLNTLVLTILDKFVPQKLKIVFCCCCCFFVVVVFLFLKVVKKLIDLNIYITEFYPVPTISYTPFLITDAQVIERLDNVSEIRADAGNKINLPCFAKDFESLLGIGRQSHRRSKNGCERIRDILVKRIILLAISIFYCSADISTSFVHQNKIRNFIDY